MIVDLDHIPAVFIGLSPNTRAMALCLDHGTKYGWAALESFGKTISIHLEIVYWTASVLKQMKEDWPQIIDKCLAMGGKSLVAINKNYTDKRWPKLIKHFGFPAPAVIAISHQEVLHG